MIIKRWWVSRWCTIVGGCTTDRDNVPLLPMRYFTEISYNGTNYSGWQIQPNATSIQQTIQEAMSLILGADIQITGCGRTDAGVHAADYTFHFDYDGKFPDKFIPRINKYLPYDIAFKEMYEVTETAHARFDAFRRSYEYKLGFKKDPFTKETVYRYGNPMKPDFDKMQEAAVLLLQYEDFAPFCKTNSDAKTMRCEMHRSEWVENENGSWSYHVTANRFLRGMIRLIVGMCINVGTGKLELKEGSLRKTP